MWRVWTCFVVGTFGGEERQGGWSGNKPDNEWGTYVPNWSSLLAIAAADAADAARFWILCPLSPRPLPSALCSLPSPLVSRSIRGLRAFPLGLYGADRGKSLSDLPASP
jgi:hypothetical protein